MLSLKDSLSVNFESSIGKHLIMAEFISEEKDPGTCSYCRKQFDFLSSFLRHVSHRKLCKKFYDENQSGFIESMKKEARLKSRKRYFKNAWDYRIKEERKAKRDNVKSTQNKYYVSVNEKSSFAGKILHFHN